MINGNIGRITHDGGFVNLYGGQALTADGQIVDMSDLEPVENLKTKEAEASEDSESDSETAESDDAKVESTGTATVVERDVNYEAAETALTVLPESVPLYTGEYEGYGPHLCWIYPDDGWSGRDLCKLQTALREERSAVYHGCICNRW